MSSKCFHLITITSPEAFSPVVDCLWTSFSQPYMPFLNTLFPVFSPSPSAFAAAVAESKIRMWEWHTTDPSSSWVAVVDDTTEKVLGAAHWNHHDSNPYEHGIPDLTAVWWPEGEGREFATSMMAQCYGLRGKRMWRAHARRSSLATSTAVLANPRSSVPELDIMFTHPSHRQKGVGSLLMKYGMDLAAEKNLEVVVEASEDGRWLYDKFGLRSLGKEVFDTSKKNPSDLWRKLAHEFGYVAHYWMWKPKEGVYVEGVTKCPWEVEIPGSKVNGH
ncbi:MAG: hypothetical protein MMC33_002732 [Icmadophila ericetorum]|nr:hypothetical protein [Icmadophila ericetorum]